MWLCHLDEGGVLLVEEDLDPVHVSVDAEQGEQVVALSRVLLKVGHQKNTTRAQLVRVT